MHNIMCYRLAQPKFFFTFPSSPAQWSPVYPARILIMLTTNTEPLPSLLSPVEGCCRLQDHCHSVFSLNHPMPIPIQKPLQFYIQDH